MTRKSKREIERAIEAIGPPDDGGKGLGLIAYRHRPDGPLVDKEGEEIGPDADILMVIERVHVMSRERAEEDEDWEILGPAEDAPPGRDLVRAAWQNELP